AAAAPAWTARRGDDGAAAPWCRPTPGPARRHTPGARPGRSGPGPCRRCSSELLQLLLQGFAGAEQVGLHRALAATHDLRGGLHVQFLQHPQRERLALARRQPAQGAGEPGPRLAAVVLARRIGRGLVGPVDLAAVLVARVAEPFQAEAAPA